MKKLLLAAGIVMTQLCAFAQNEPFGFSLSSESFSQLKTEILPTFDHTLLLEEDSRQEMKGGRSNYGRIIKSPVNAENAGIWRTLRNGDRIWQYRFKTSGAKGVNVYFDNLYLPVGSAIVMYPADRSYYLGPFGNHDCSPTGHFMMGEILSDEAIIEYFEPASVVGKANIGISGFAHLYRYVYDYRGEQRGGGSDVCEVEVNCPEGDAWQQERDAVVRLEIVSSAGVGSCSGTLVNNLNKDCKKYILTAMHCGEDVTDTEWLDCSVRFKYQRAGCTSGSTPSTYNKVGVFHRADSNDGGGNSGSDFLLLEMEDDIPTSWTPFYAGWSAETTTPNSGVSIHHPAGDRKKISTTENIVSGTYNATGFHWRVRWMQTETNWGVTEPGSSGSPLFDQDHHLVGTLTGGLSFCDTPTAYDYYGKVSKHWTANPNAANQKLKVWLDPNNTGILSMNGSYVNSGASSPCDPGIVSVDEKIMFDDVSIFPSLADAYVNISTPKYNHLHEINVHNNAGKLIASFTMNTSNYQLSTAELANGVYFISLIDDSGNFVTKKFMVSHL